MSVVVFSLSSFPSFCLSRFLVNQTDEILNWCETGFKCVPFPLLTFFHIMILNYIGKCG